MLEELKEQVCSANKQLVENKLVLFTWGNVSAIDKERKYIAIKPSGVSFSELSPGDIVIVDCNGVVVEGSKTPSCDTATHLELYKHFPDIAAVVHTHSLYATIFAQARKEINCIGTTHADEFLGSIPLTRDFTGDEVETEYEKNVGKAIVECFRKKGLSHLQIPACLVAGHGPFIWGQSLNQALYNAHVLEYIARMNAEVLKITPSPETLSPFLMEKHFLRKHGKHAYYGQEKGKC